MMAAGGRILIVDDDRSLRRVLELNLAARGYEIDVAGSGAAALVLSARRPDLIILDLDLGLPDIDGIDLITQLRASLTTPILVTSARDIYTAKIAALAAGAADYLPKPFGVDHLMNKVRAILSDL